jgi:hypothetical protein
VSYLDSCLYSIMTDSTFILEIVLICDFSSFLFCSCEIHLGFLQQKKREMVASAFGEDGTGGRQTRLTVEDLKYLFMM